MHIELLAESQHATNTLVELMRTCDRAAWAVAWATDNHEVWDAAYEHRGKFRNFVVGTHSYITSPSVIERFQAEPAFRVMRPDGPLFHPKIYVFRLGEETVVVVGSHNLTRSAFTSNIEASTLLRGSATEPALRQLFKFVTDAWSRGAEVTPEFLFSYASNHRRAAKLLIQLEDWVPAEPSRATDGIPGPDELDWARFAELVKIEKSGSTHTLEGRLRVLEGINSIFKKAPTYAELDEDDRKRVAGTMGEVEARQKDGNGFDWAWFGAMGSNGSFSTTVLNDPGGISRALDHIPMTGPVGRDQYDAFVEVYKTALSPDLYASGGIGNGTRLLAMKRPDQFVCLCSPNRRGIAEHFNVPYNTTLDTYWDRIVQRIRGTPWWNSPEPSDEHERKVWAGRAALLDAIYYDPAQRT